MSGSASEVGVVGYTLGGGQSPLLGRSHGYAADHVRWQDVVGADGESRRVAPEAEPEFYWSPLGGKGNFGVVTALEFEAFSARRFYGGGAHFRGEDLERVLAARRAWLSTVGEDMTSSIATQCGFTSLWVYERLLFPVAPLGPLYGNLELGDSWPDYYK